LNCPKCNAKNTKTAKFCKSCGERLQGNNKKKNDGKICPYCHAVIKPSAKTIICPKCGIPHHKECWDENGGCTTYGCKGKKNSDVKKGNKNNSVMSKIKNIINNQKPKTRNIIKMIIWILIIIVFVVLYETNEKNKQEKQNLQICEGVYLSYNYYSYAEGKRVDETKLFTLNEVYYYLKKNFPVLGDLNEYELDYKTFTKPVYKKTFELYRTILVKAELSNSNSSEALQLYFDKEPKKRIE
jgi:hypothetical protein